MDVTANQFLAELVLIDDAQVTAVIHGGLRSYESPHITKIRKTAKA